MKPIIHLIFMFSLLLAGNTILAQEQTTVKVYNESDLRAIAEATTNGGQSYSNVKITLESDITIQGDSWKPIGLYYDAEKNTFPFQGEFDGQGHTITFQTPLAVVSSEGDKETLYLTGLFGVIGTAGTVMNLNINTGDMHISLGDIGSGDFGIITSCNAGLIENCSVSGNINIRSEVLYNFNNFGCIAGYQHSSGAMKNCINLASIYSDKISSVGGLVGDSLGGIIMKSINKGNISSTGFAEIGGDAKSVGGIVAECSGTRGDGIIYLINCLNYGNITVAENAIAAGGVVGKTMLSTIVFYCGNSGDIISKAYYSGGIIGKMVGSALIGSYHAGKVNSLSSNPMIGYKLREDVQVIKWCSNINDGNSQTFIKKANSKFRQEKKTLLGYIQEDWSVSYFAPSSWISTEHQHLPHFE